MFDVVSCGVGLADLCLLVDGCGFGWCVCNSDGCWWLFRFVLRLVVSEACWFGFLDLELLAVSVMVMVACLVLLQYASLLLVLCVVACVAVRFVIVYFV